MIEAGPGVSEAIVAHGELGEGSDSVLHLGRLGYIDLLPCYGGLSAEPARSSQLPRATVRTQSRHLRLRNVLERVLLSETAGVRQHGGRAALRSGASDRQSRSVDAAAIVDMDKVSLYLEVPRDWIFAVRLNTKLDELVGMLERRGRRSRASIEQLRLGVGVAHDVRVGRRDETVHLRRLLALHTQQLQSFLVDFVSLRLYFQRAHVRSVVEYSRDVG